MGEINNEGQLQAAFFSWLHDWDHDYWELTFHVPNGGYRHPAEAMQLKRQGVKAGIPDVCFPFPVAPYHGLYIEFKWGYNKLSPFQSKIMTKLSKNGYCCKVCYNLESAIRIIHQYLRIEYVQQSSVPIIDNSTCPRCPSPPQPKRRRIAGSSVRPRESGGNISKPIGRPRKRNIPNGDSDA